MSASRSLGSSTPIDRRIVPSVMPSALRSSALMPECVVEAGWQISDSVPPRLTASLMSWMLLRSLNATSRPPLTLKAKVEPALWHCFLKISCSRVPGYRAGDQVAVAGEVLGHRIGDQVGAVQDRLLVDRAEEGVVDHQDRLVS